MADNWTDWYSGNMAPPLVMPGGGYAPAPVQAPMSVDDIYRGIYSPAAPSLTSVSRPTVPINPQTGMPYATTANASAKYGAGIGAGGTGDVRYSPPRQFQPNPLPGVRDLGAPQYGTPGSGGGVLTPAGLPGNATIDKRFTERVPAPPYGGYVAAPRFASLPKAPDYRGYTGSMRFASTPQRAGDGIVDLNDAFSPKAAQAFADSEGKPFRVKGTIYYPGKAPSGNVTGSLSAPDNRGPLGRALGLKTSGFGGLLGGLFGGLFGGGAAPQTSGGSSGPAPAPSYTTTPFQEDRFQTTTGAQMPSSMNNSRWQTGY